MASWGTRQGYVLPLPFQSQGYRDGALILDFGLWIVGFLEGFVFGGLIIKPLPVIVGYNEYISETDFLKGNCLGRTRLRQSRLQTVIPAEAGIQYDAGFSHPGFPIEAFGNDEFECYARGRESLRSMIIRFVDEARIEFLDAISYYEASRVGLGQRFKDEVERCVLWIADHPELYLQTDG